MGNSQRTILLSFICAVLLWPQVQTRRISSAGDATSTEKREEGGPLVVKRSVSCDISFDKYCLNKGQCMFLVDLNESYCKCEMGFHGPRCEQPQLVVRPMREEQVALIVVCVFLLIVGLAGALYFFCKWYKRNSLPQQQKQPGYRGVQTA